MRAAAVILVLPSALWGTPAAGQETVEFQLKLVRGEVIYSSFIATAQLTLQIADQRQSSTIQVEAREATRVLAVDPDGTMLVEVVFEDYRITENGRTQEAVDPPLTLKVRPNGKVVERQTGEYPDEDFPFGFPGRAVRVGENWTTQMRIEEAGVSGQGSVTYTLAGLERAGNERVARLTYRTEGRVTGADLGPLPPGAEISVSGTVRGSGEIFWSVERGRALRINDDVTVESQVEVTAQGQTVRVSLTMQSMGRREPLPAARVTVPVVAADFLVAPGKGIGPFTLDQAVADLTSRLGESRAGSPVPGVRTPVLFWPNGLEAYVDEADRNKVLALEIADRRYRTEKGITFGSSQGAVLMGYGMSPARWTSPFPTWVGRAC